MGSTPQTKHDHMSRSVEHIPRPTGYYQGKPRIARFQELLMSIQTGQRVNTRRHYALMATPQTKLRITLATLAPLPRHGLRPHPQIGGTQYGQRIRQHGQEVYHSCPLLVRDL